MGKGTDKLYITHSEWNSGDRFSASAGSGVPPDNAGHTSFKRLSFRFCALSLQPFESPVCTADGQIFDHENIVRWLLNHVTNPTNGKPLKQADLIKLNFAKSDAGDFIDPVTFKVFTDNTHIVAIRHGSSANVFAYDTVERLNIKPKMWKDLVSDEAFSRGDVLTLQDPINLANRDLANFKHIQENEDVGALKAQGGVNVSAIGNAAQIIRAKDAVAKARAERLKPGQVHDASQSKISQVKVNDGSTKKTIPYNASYRTTGLAAASFTSTGVTPHTSASLALLSEEEYLLKPRRVKQKGYVRISTSLGDMTFELYPEFAPKAVWNFVRLAGKGYYNGVKFHRNIKNFMVQGGDPTGTGKGGQSFWGKNFEDEFEGPLKHDSRGIVSMANKGKDTNSSQFFILYRDASHLNRKHTIFGQVADGLEVLQKMENSEVDASSRPKNDIVIKDIVVLIDPFQVFLQEREKTENAEMEKESARLGNADEHRTTWTGKRIREDGSIENSSVQVGKYLKSKPKSGVDDEVVGEVGEEDGVFEPVKKKARSQKGFGNFDSW